MADFHKVIRLDPLESKAFYNRGLIHYHQDNLEDAIADYDHAIRLNPEYVGAYVNRGVAHLSWALKKSPLRDFFLLEVRLFVMTTRMSSVVQSNQYSGGAPSATRRVWAVP